MAIATQNPDSSFTLAAPGVTPANTPSAFTASQPNTINSSTLNPQNPITPTQPTPTPVYPTTQLAPVTPPLTETPSQQKETSLAQQIMNLTNEDSGKASFTADQYKALGFGMTYDAQGNIVPDAGTADLTAKLQTLKNEALAIPLKDANAGVGRMTTAGVQSEDTINLRNNAIQSLQVSSTIDAMNGNLTTAQHKVDAAVIQKFGPIEAHITALKANLQMIKDDPQTSIEEKNQAQAQLDNVKAQQAQIDKQKTDQSNIWKIAITAASKGNYFKPTADYPTLATALTAIQNASDPTTALSIADNTGLAGVNAPATTLTGLQDGKTFVSGSLNYSPTEFHTDQQHLISTRGADGFVDPAVYLAGLQAWLNKGGLQQDFLKIYPIKDYINPANTWPKIVSLGGGHKPKKTSGSGGAQTP